MGTDIGHIRPLTIAAPWQCEAAQLLEEHHLAAWAHNKGHRGQFGSQLASYLRSMDDTHVCELPGQAIRDIFSFCNYLERGLGNDRIRRSVDARGGIVDALRTAPERTNPIRHRFILWHDADVLLRYDHRLFGRLADAMMGVSAELEYTSEDLLMIQRVVFIGAPSLDLYSENPKGQFREWYTEGDEEPLWQTVTGVRVPPVLQYNIDPMFDAPAHEPAKPRSSRSRSAKS